MSKEKPTKRKIFRRVVLTVIAAVILLGAVIVGMCLFNERPAVQPVAVYQSAYGDTIVNTADDGGVEILPQNGEADTGIIFYVGAQITPDAYIPLLARLAQQGYACFIPNLTFNMAAIEPKAADDIRLELMIEHSDETGKTNMRIRYNGEINNVLDLADTISNKLIESAASGIEYRKISEEVFTNELLMQLNA